MEETNTTAQAAPTAAPVQESAPAQQQTTQAPAKEPEIVANVLAETPKEPKMGLRERLARKIAEAEEKEKAAAPQKSADSAQKAPETTPGVEDVVIPRSIREEERAAFEKLPVEMKRFIARREAELERMGHDRVQRAAQMEREFAPVLEHYKKYESDYLRRGIKASDVIARSIEWDMYFQQNPKQAAKEYLAAYGVDPADLVLDGDDVAPTQQFDPVQLREQISQEIRQELLAKQEQERAEFLINHAKQSAEEFFKGTPFGSDEHNLTELRQAMAPIASKLEALDPTADVRAILQESYDYVTTKDPRFASIRKSYEQAQLAQKSKAEAAQAIFAGRSLSGSPGSNQPTNKPKSFREALTQKLDGVM